MIERHALAHADQTVPGALGRRGTQGAGAVAVIENLDRQGIERVVQRDGRGDRAGVFEGIGQGLLDNAVGRDVDADG